MNDSRLSLCHSTPITRTHDSSTAYQIGESNYSQVVETKVAACEVPISVTVHLSVLGNRLQSDLPQTLCMADEDSGLEIHHSPSFFPSFFLPAPVPASTLADRRAQRGVASSAATDVRMVCASGLFGGVCIGFWTAAGVDEAAVLERTVVARQLCGEQVTSVYMAGWSVLS